MENVKINRDNLLKIVRENREAHLKEYQEAYEGYCTELAKALSEVLPTILAAKPFEMPNLNKPQSHKKEYDRVIRMLELSEDAIIQLQDYEFERYVQDEWEWTQHFKVTNRTYNSKRM